jgi:hypothetical protein
MVKIEITDDEGATADEHDTALQAFFDASKVSVPEVSQAPEVPAVVIDGEEQDIPF